MLSSRWRGINVYECCTSDDRAPIIYVVATNKSSAREAYRQLTREEPDDCYLYLSDAKVVVTEEAQAQSELFPNQVRK